jgi:hypothetical protein
MLFDILFLIDTFISLITTYPIRDLSYEKYETNILKVIVNRI